MNIEEDFALLLPVCVSLILFPVLGEDEDIGERRFFLSVLAITIQKQTEILREKTSRGVLVIQLCQKSPRYRGDIALYYIHFEITGDPCNLIGSQQCDLFLNRIIFCSKSHLFSQQCDLFSNRTIFCSKSHHFSQQWHLFTNRTIFALNHIFSPANELFCIHTET